MRFGVALGTGTVPASQLLLIAVLNAMMVHFNDNFYLKLSISAQHFSQLPRCRRMLPAAVPRLVEPSVFVAPLAIDSQLSLIVHICK